MRLNKKSSPKSLLFRAAPKSPAEPIHDSEDGDVSEELLVEEVPHAQAIPPRRVRKGLPRNVLLGAGGVLVLLTGLLLLRPQPDPADTFASDSVTTVDSTALTPPPPGALTVTETPPLSGQPATENTTSPGAKPNAKTTTKAKTTKADPKKAKPGDQADASPKRSTREARGVVATDVPNVFQASDETGPSTVSSGNLSTPSTSVQSAPQAASPAYNPPLAPAPQPTVNASPAPQNTAPPPPVPPTSIAVAPPALTQPRTTPGQNTTSAPVAITRIPRPQASVPPRVRTFPAPIQPTTIQPVVVPLTTAPTVVVVPNKQRSTAPVTLPTGRPIVINPGTPPTTVTLTQSPSNLPVTVPPPATITPSAIADATPTLTQTPPSLPGTVTLTPDSGMTNIAVPQLQVQAIVTGDAPTATIRTPIGEQVVAIGEKLLETPYTVKAIKAQSVVLEAENTTSDLTLELEDNT